MWGKNIASLKGQTTRTTPNPVTEDLLKVPRDILNLHMEVFLSIDVFFVNKIPFLLALSKNICCTAANHLTDKTVPQIFKAFKDIYQYYLHLGFRVTVIHADGELHPSNLCSILCPVVPCLT
jgi:hypothetical protein